MHLSKQHTGSHTIFHAGIPGISAGSATADSQIERSQLCATQPATFFLPDERLLIAVVHPKAAIPLSAKPGHGLNVWFPVGAPESGRTGIHPKPSVRKGPAPGS